MYTLTRQEILRIWEVGKEQHPVDRALTILAVVFPELLPEQLPTLSIGQRDAHLLAAYERNFGSRLACFAVCQECRERLEFVLDLAEMGVSPAAQFAGDGNAEVMTSHGGHVSDNAFAAVYQMSAEGYELHFHLPNSLDLAAIAGGFDAMTARAQLVRCCVVQAHQGGVEVAVEALPETVIKALSEQMIERDPQAEIQLDLICPACEHRWPVIFDIVPFFWAEVCAQAKLLLQEVHILALAYGWREADILSMSAARRQFYLEMVT